MAFLDVEAAVHWSYLMYILMMTLDILSNAEAGAHCIDSPYAFPCYNILQREYTAQYTQTNMN
jgi:hypothetical protein